MEQHPPPAYPVQNRMEGHVKAVAIINIVFAVLGFLAALLLLFAFGIASAVTGASGAPGWVPSFLGGLGMALVLIPLAYAVLCLMAGLKLMARKQVGKTLAIITSILSLFSFPIGTAIGVYALWVLFQKETDQLLTP